MEEKIEEKEINNELKKLKEEINKLKEDIGVLKVDKQIKDFKIQFLESRINLQDEQIKLLKQNINNNKQQSSEIIKDNKNKEMNKDNKNDDKNKETNNDKNKNIINKPNENQNINKENKSLNIKFECELTNKAPKYASLPSMFSIYTTKNKENYLCYITEKHNMEIYDIENKIIKKTFENIHNSDIYCCNYFYDEKNKKDLIITSSYDKSIKIWDLKLDSENKPLTEINNAHDSPFIFAVCILYNKNLDENFIISGSDEDFIKIYDFNKNIIKSVKIDFYINYLCTYYDQELNKYYIINSNTSDVRIYDFDTLEIYKKFIVKPIIGHTFIYIQKINKITQLIENDFNGCVRIWNFHTGELIQLIESKSPLNGFCVIDNKFMISGSRDKQIKIFDLNNGKIIDFIEAHDKECLSVKYFKHKILGDCIISHGKDGILKLWSVNLK